MLMCGQKALLLAGSSPRAGSPKDILFFGQWQQFSPVFQRGLLPTAPRAAHCRGRPMGSPQGQNCSWSKTSP